MIVENYISFNPYFSGFRSYTDFIISSTLGLINLVSILISVDSGLIPDTMYHDGKRQGKFQSLFQWIPVLYQRNHHRKTEYHPVSILISVDSGLIPL